MSGLWKAEPQGCRQEVGVTRQEVFFHLSQVAAILHSKRQLKCKDQGLEGSFI